MRPVNLAIDMENCIGKLFVPDKEYEEEHADLVLRYERCRYNDTLELAPYVRRIDFTLQDFLDLIDERWLEES